MKSMIYVGDDERLLGEKALIIEGVSKCHARFDSIALPQSHGWHKFDKKDFISIENLKEQNNFINSLYEEYPDLKEDGLKEFDGYFTSYNNFIKRISHAWDHTPCYNNDPFELIVNLINERDEAFEKIKKAENCLVCVAIADPVEVCHNTLEILKTEE